MAKNRVIPFGYCMKNGKTMVNFMESKAVIKIFEEYLNGSSLLQIAKLHEKLANKSLNVQKTLSEQLSEEQKKLLDELISIQDSLSMIVSEENYSAGFRDGAGMMMDVLEGKNINLKEL